MLLDSTGKKATGVLDVNVLTGEEVEQPADLVILRVGGLPSQQRPPAALVGHRQALRPSRPARGLVGANYCLSGGRRAHRGAIQLFFDDSGLQSLHRRRRAGRPWVDDFHYNQDFDRAKAGGYIGGAMDRGGRQQRPADQLLPGPARHPAMGLRIEAREVAKWYQGAVGYGERHRIGHAPPRQLPGTLDPTYKNRFGQPPWRMTFDFHENEQKMNRHSAEVIGQIGRAMNPTIMGNPNPRLTWNVVPYQSTHNTGGAVMGADPGAGARNKYLQSWDVTNLFVMGASRAFPHNSGYNPTGPGRRARLLGGGCHPRAVPRRIEDRWFDPRADPRPVV